MATTETSSNSSISYKGRPGSLDLQSQEYSIFPFDVFELDDANKVDEPVLRLKEPWKFYVTNNGYFGFESYSGDTTYENPGAGDRRIYIDGDEIICQEYTNGAWSSVNQLRIGGVDSNGIFTSGVACRQVVNPLSDTLGQEFIISNDFNSFSFETDYSSQNGISPDSSTNVSRSAVWSKFGSYSLLATSGNEGTLVYNDLMDLDGLITFGTWLNYNLDTSGAGSLYLFQGYYRVDASNYLLLQLLYDTYSKQLALYFYEYVGGSSVQTKSIEINTDLDGVHYIGCIVNASTGNIDFIIDDVVSTETVSPITLTGTSTVNTVTLYTYNNYELYGSSFVTLYVDDALFATDNGANVDFLLQHYLHGVVWDTTYSARDLILLAADGGYVNLSQSPTKYYAPVSGEESLGTPHPFDRTVTAWDLAARTELAGSPYEWDLSSLIPVGTKKVKVLGLLYSSTTSARPFNTLVAWDYDSGSYTQYKPQAGGIALWASARAAISISPSSVYAYSGEFDVLIGESRKLYIGMSYTGYQVFYAQLKGYFI